MKKALWSAAFMLLFSMTMLVGTTFAWFTDSYTNKENQISFGTLDMELTYCDPAEIADETFTMEGDWYSFHRENSTVENNLFDVAGLQPGSVVKRYVKVKNVGDIDFEARYNLAYHSSLANVEVRILDKYILNQGQFFRVNTGEYTVLEVTLTVKTVLNNDYQGQTKLKIFDITFDALQIAAAKELKDANLG